jgi:hypothetical protein
MPSAGGLGRVWKGLAMVAMTPKKKTWMPKRTARTKEARQGSR